MTPVEQPDKTRPPLVKAWVSVVCIPVFVLLSIAAGYGVYGVLGYVDGTGSPIWADIVVLSIGLFIVAIPCAAAVVFGRRALAAGDREGKVPMVLAILAGAAFAILTIVSVVGDAVRASS